MGILLLLLSISNDKLVQLHSFVNDTCLPVGGLKVLKIINIINSERITKQSV